jgi:hypothetical protein
VAFWFGKPVSADFAREKEMRNVFIKSCLECSLKFSI